MPAPAKRLKDLIEGTVDHHVTIRWRGLFGCLIAWAGDGDDNVPPGPAPRRNSQPRAR